MAPSTQEIEAKLAKDRIKARKWQRANPEKVKAMCKAWREANRPYNLARMRAHRLRRKYGISIAEYDALVTKHGGVCAMCGKPDQRGRLAVDHCHKTGRVRGLLCRTCNVGLGYVERLLERMPRVIAYLGGVLVNDC